MAPSARCEDHADQRVEEIAPAGKTRRQEIEAASRHGAGAS
jgi:hypothetical protein